MIKPTQFNPTQTAVALDHMNRVFLTDDYLKAIQCAKSVYSYPHSNQLA